jgi:RNA polymerase sigma-70 factor (ECF subfamily)
MDDKRGRFELQVLPHLDAAYRFARWLSRSSVDADDIVQDAVLRAYRGFDMLRGTDVKAWLLTIVRNCHATARKQQRRHAAEPLSEEHEHDSGDTSIATTSTPEGATLQRDDARTLERLLADLPDDYRQVLVLREIEDMHYREIAAVMNVPIGTVMSRLARARAALKKNWLQQSAGEPRAVP